MKSIKFLSLAFACLCVFSTVHAVESLGDKLGNLLGDLSPSSPFGEEFLDPDEAFALSAEVQGSERINIHWDIADGYYLYRDRLQFKIDTPGVELARQALPPGKLKADPLFGDVFVYYGDVDVSLPLLRQRSDISNIELTVVSQGCKDGSVCYPPQTRKLALQLPAAGAGNESGLATAGTPASTPGATIMQSQQDRISHSLREQSILVNILVFFGFGLLLSLTPCIFPMIPILSGIIVGQGHSIGPRLAFLLSLSYVVTMALTYAVLGVIAGSFQINLQAASQNAWAITLFSLVFVLLALSMFGFYELQLPTRWQDRLNRWGQRQKSGSLLGAGIMGVLSAIIVGPCVAPPLAGALLYISQTGNAALGGAALFALGLGLGVPLLIIGTSAGKLLPRAGAWMQTVKYIFGVLMLAVAIWFMGRILPGALTLFLWGLLFTVCAVYMGALERLDMASGWQKLRKGLAIVAIVYGIALIIGAAGGSQDIFRPLQLTGSDNTSESILPFEKIKSATDLDRILADARQQGQVVMLDFYADWCITCKEMERFTFPRQEVRAALSDMRLLKADVTANNDMDQELMRRFDIIGPPAILFFVYGEEQRAYRLVGFIRADDFVRHLRQVKAL